MDRCRTYLLLIGALRLSVPHFRENVDRASDEREYEGEILTEVLELEAESEEDYQKKLSEYKKQLEDWKLWKKKQVPTSHSSPFSLSLVMKCFTFISIAFTHLHCL